MKKASWIVTGIVGLAIGGALVGVNQRYVKPNEKYVTQGPVLYEGKRLEYIRGSKNFLLKAIGINILRVETDSSRVDYIDRWNNNTVDRVNVFKLKGRHGADGNSIYSLEKSIKKDVFGSEVIKRAQTDFRLFQDGILDSKLKSVENAYNKALKRPEQSPVRK